MHTDVLITLLLWTLGDITARWVYILVSRVTNGSSSALESIRTTVGSIQTDASVEITNVHWIALAYDPSKLTGRNLFFFVFNSSASTVYCSSIFVNCVENTDLKNSRHLHGAWSQIPSKRMNKNWPPDSSFGDLLPCMNRARTCTDFTRIFLAFLYLDITLICNET
jgi:hypothetical protein